MADPAPTTQRAVALAVLLVTGILSLPVVAALLDGGSTEGWVVPVQLLLMAVVGAVVGRLLPGIAGAGASPGRGALVGAVVGVATALATAVVFMVLLGGP